MDHSVAFLAEGGQVGDLMHGADWSASPLGLPRTWSVSLRTTVALMLSSKFPMFLAWGPDLGFLYNDAYSVLLGEKHPSALGRRFPDVWAEIWPEIRPLVEKALAGQAVWYEDLPLILSRHGHDEEAFFTFSYSPARDESGVVSGVFCTTSETTRNVLATRRIVAERERLSSLFEQAPSFMAMLQGPEHRIILANPAYRRLVGDRDLIGRPLQEALPEAAGQGYVSLLDEVFQSGRAHTSLGRRYDMQAVPGGPIDERYLDFVFQPILDVENRVVGIFVEGSDVTERKRSEDHLQLMINELNHRVKNSLATVQAIAAQTFRNVSAFDQVKEDFTGRIIALAKANDVLTEANWSRASLGEVIEKAVEPYRADGQDQFRCMGPHVLLSPKAALALALAFHELCTNAAKHGALSASAGMVEIVWWVSKVPDGRRLHLRWSEKDGPPVLQPRRKGFGTRLINQGLTGELDGKAEVRYEPGGVVCVIDVPLTEG